MSVWVQYNGHFAVHFDGPVALRDIKNEHFKYHADTDVYFTCNGKKMQENAIVHNGIIRASSRLLGGKGGFGSMLRAIGAQIEKTTNREACRDLSGRRLRDINEEKRLKNWIAQQAEREREAAERRKKKLDRLCFEPKHDFTDQSYEKARTELTEKVHDAVEQGFRSASTSTKVLKRKPDSHESSQPKKKKTCLWVDDIDEDDLSSLDSDSDAEPTKVIEGKVDVGSYPQKLGDVLSNSEEEKHKANNENERKIEDLPSSTCSVVTSDATNVTKSLTGDMCNAECDDKNTSIKVVSITVSDVSL